MNLLLVEPAELHDDGRVVIADRRAVHLRTVLRVVTGSTVRAGVLGGGTGTAEVLADDGSAITLRVVTTAPAPDQLDIELVLAIPRPKVLSRVIEACAAFGVRRIDLTNAWRVDKSYLDSPRLELSALATAARLGAEQGAKTLLPELHVHDRLMALLDERFVSRGTSDWLLAHPGSPPIERTVTSRRPTILAVGPEGGWIEREVETFVARGFAPIALGTPILRVETAVAAALGQLVMLERIRAR